MNWNKPSRDEIIRAIDAYLPIAYPGAPLPNAVRARVESVRTADDAGLYALPAFETDKADPTARIALRLGNRLYPHMKLVIEASPDGSGHLFRADTHDQHVRPQPGSRDAEAFCQLMAENQRIAEQIELAWEQAKLPTFKAYLRRDLAQRLAAKQHGDGTAPEPG